MSCVVAAGADAGAAEADRRLLASRSIVAKAIVSGWKTHRRTINQAGPGGTRGHQAECVHWYCCTHFLQKMPGDSLLTP